MPRSVSQKAGGRVPYARVERLALTQAVSFSCSKGGTKGTTALCLTDLVKSSDMHVATGNPFQHKIGIHHLEGIPCNPKVSLALYAPLPAEIPIILDSQAMCKLQLNSHAKFG